MHSRISQPVVCLWLAVLAVCVGCKKKAESKETLAAIGVKPFTPPTKVASKNHNDLDYRHEWNRFTTVENYKVSGKKDPKWDANAVAALEAFAQIRALPPFSDREAALRTEIKEQAAEAVASGCDDPLVKYLYIRFTLTQKPQMTDAILASEGLAVAQLMESTGYAPIRKAYANLRAAEALKFSLGTNGHPPSLTQLRAGAIEHLEEALHDSMMPPQEAEELCSQVWKACEINDGARSEIEQLLLPTAERLWSEQAFTHLLKGKIHIKKAWDARGTGFADTVTSKGWEAFKENLKISDKALRKAWELEKKDTAIPLAMISVCVGEELPRAEMEIWFNRAMQIDPACFAAVQAKANYLDPKWYGSAEDVLEFGRQCVASTQWKGTVPLFLVDAHVTVSRYLEKEQQPKYWLNPAVWMDVRNSYERFFELNPEEVSYRHNYAWWAYKCGKHREFLEQVALFPSINYEYFGGRQEFDRMVRVAKDVTK